jgi:metal-responsive CopG/Arc/MetJ family transcriptional regulator
MKKKKLINPVGVVLDDYLYQELMRVTDELEMSKSEFIRKLIEEQFKVKVTVHEGDHEQVSSREHLLLQNESQ